MSLSMPPGHIPPQDGSHAIIDGMSTPDRQKQIGAFLKESRTRAGLSQSDVAEAMSTEEHPIRQTQIAKMEAGTRPVSLLEALAFMEAVHRPPHELLTAFDQSPEGALISVIARLENLGQGIASLTDSYDQQDASAMEPLLQMFVEAGTDTEMTLQYANLSTSANLEIRHLLTRASWINSAHITFLNEAANGVGEPLRTEAQLRKTLDNDAT